MLAPPKHVLVYRDAPGFCHAGFVAIFNGVATSSDTHISPDGCLIYPVFTNANLFLQFTHYAPCRSYGRAPLFLDVPKIAAPTLVRGNCTSSLGGVLASTFWAAAYGIPVWVGEVRSKFNCADPPAHVSPLIGVAAMVIASPNGTFRPGDSLLCYRLGRSSANSEFWAPWPLPPLDKTDSV